MKISVLDQRHPSYDAREWLVHRAFYSGGKALLAEPVISEVLHKGASEPGRQYDARKRRAYCVNHAAGIVDFFVAGFQSAESEVTSEPEERDDFWHDFQENCDRQDSDINQFMAGRLREAMLTQHGWTLVDLPELPDFAPESVADEDAAGLRRAYLVPLPSEAVIDWESGDEGELLWAMVRSVSSARTDPTQSRGLEVITWTAYTRDGWQRWRWRQTRPDETPKPDAEAELAGEGRHSFGAVPLVDLPLPDGLYMLGKTASLLVELFNASCGLSWARDVAMHSTVVLKTLSDDLDSKVFGNGYGIRIDPGDDIFFLEPKGTYADVARQQIVELKNELYRVSHQMAQAQDRTASAQKSSGESKRHDRSTTEVILSAFAQFEARARESILALVTAGRGEKISWTVRPADNFSIDSSAEVLADVQAAAGLNVPSKTFAKAMYLKAVTALLPDLPEPNLAKIREEIEESVDTGATPGLALTGGLDTGGGGGVQGDGAAEPDADDSQPDAFAAEQRALGMTGGPPRRGADGAGQRVAS